MKTHTNYDAETIDRIFNFVTKDDAYIRQSFFPSLSDEEWTALQKENQEIKTL